MNGIVKLIVLVTIFSGFLGGFNIQPAAAITHSFPTTIAAGFEQDQSGKWRALVNVTVTNDYTSNVTLNWIQMTTVNVTYIDDSFETLGISAGGNLTLGNRLTPGDLIIASWGVPGQQGFSKEPKNLGVVVELSVQGFENQVTPFLIVPEFPSFLSVLLIMVVALVTVILKKKSTGLARGRCAHSDLKTWLSISPKLANLFFLSAKASRVLSLGGESINGIFPIW